MERCCPTCALHHRAPPRQRCVQTSPCHGVIPLLPAVNYFQSKCETIKQTEGQSLLIRSKPRALLRSLILLLPFLPTWEQAGLWGAHWGLGGVGPWGLGDDAQSIPGPRTLLRCTAAGQGQGKQMQNSAGIWCDVHLHGPFTPLGSGYPHPTPCSGCAVGCSPYPCPGRVISLCHQTVLPPPAVCSGPWRFHHPLAMGICALLPPSLPFLPPAAATLLCPDLFSACRTSHRAALPSPHLQKCPWAAGHQDPPCALCQTGDGGEVALATVHGCGGSTGRLGVMAQGRTQRGHTQFCHPGAPCANPSCTLSHLCAVPLPTHRSRRDSCSRGEGRRKEGGRTPMHGAHLFAIRAGCDTNPEQAFQLEPFQGLNAMGVSGPFKNSVHERL